MNTPRASRTPAQLTAHAAQPNPVIGMRSPLWVTRVPHTIINDAIETGASTGPHHGSGNRKRMSQSNRDEGATHNDAQEDVIQNVPDAEGDRRVAQSLSPPPAGEQSCRSQHQQRRGFAHQLDL